MWLRINYASLRSYLQLEDRLLKEVNTMNFQIHTRLSWKCKIIKLEELSFELEESRDKFQSLYDFSPVG